ncbi:CPBP family intramembrane glutamic endopeptidase [Anaerotalea alkaliphila]|uniref:CPBP family intramembrane metalloprotease n=1 Tax=Anaerotalea alkaliphila TaxID=2662126 RepID=A0A7X5HTZ2_9FIRM|nr:CPBP family intramembrane glutamic endopeptidase [Anaerotalea alkaliphila]NDL66609.1 CPBP family intramembrane metalloprotease [Anaerotalea alkaliphila]
MRKAARFVLLVFAATFAYAELYYSGLFPRSSASDLAMALFYMWIPGIVAILLHRREGGTFRSLVGRPRWNRWFLFAWLVFPILSFANIPVNLLFPGVEFSLRMGGFLERYRDVLPPEQFAEMAEQLAGNPAIPLLLLVLQGLLAGATVNALAGLGEELGWRGRLNASLEFLGFWPRSLVIGTVWGFWHAPLILRGHNYPGYPVAGVFLMVLWCILLTPVHLLVREKTGSVLAAAVAHGTLNATAGISLVYLVGGHPLVNGLLGASGFLTLALFNLGIWAFRRRVFTDR